MENASTHVRIGDPPIARALFESTQFSWLLLIVRVYVGWQWLSEGLAKAADPGWAGAGAGTFLTTWVTRA